jgi:hypothetical protein
MTSERERVSAVLLLYNDSGLQWSHLIDLVTWVRDGGDEVSVVMYTDYHATIEALLAEELVGMR